MPAKHIKWRFDEETIRHELNEIAWYEWEDKIIKERIKSFYDVEDFIYEYYYRKEEMN